MLRLRIQFVNSLIKLNTMKRFFHVLSMFAVFFLYNAESFAQTPPPIVPIYTPSDLPQTVNSTQNVFALDMDDDGFPEILIGIGDISGNPLMIISDAYSPVLVGSSVFPPRPNSLFTISFLFVEDTDSIPPIMGGIESGFTTLYSLGQTIYLDTTLIGGSGLTPPISPLSLIALPGMLLAPPSDSYLDGMKQGYIGFCITNLSGSEIYNGWIEVSEIDDNLVDPSLTIGSAYMSPVPFAPVMAGLSASTVPIPLIASIAGFLVIGASFFFRRRRKK